MKYFKTIFLLFFLIGCATKPNYKKGDCYSLLTRDITVGVGVYSPLSLQVWKSERRKGVDGKYRDYLFFRPIINDKYWKEVDLKPKKRRFTTDATGIIWMERHEFDRMIYDPDNKMNNQNFGWSRFSYGEGTRNGITCNKWDE